MAWIAGLGYRKDAVLARQESERDLPRRSAVRRGHFVQRLALGKMAAAERAIGDHGHAVLRAPRNQRVLDRAFLEVVEHLVARDALADGGELLEVRDVEVADAPREDLAFFQQLLEGGNRVRERIAAAPVQQVAIDAVGAQALQ